MAYTENGFLGDEISSKTIKDRLSLYIAKWPLFAICILVCVGTGVFYLSFAIPKYIATTTFLVKQSGNSKLKSNDLLEEVLNGKPDVNMSSEIMVVSSRRLVERTVGKNNFNTSYYLKGRLHSINVYKDAPFILIPENFKDSNNIHTLHIKEINPQGGIILLDPDKQKDVYSFEWGKKFNVNGQSFILQSKYKIQKTDAEYIVKWQPTGVVAHSLLEELSAHAYESKANAIELSLKTENLQFGQDVLDALYEEFNLMDIEDRNKLSESTVQFIDDRLLNISKDLKGVEGSLENYQGSNQLIDIKEQSSESLENSSEINRTIKDIVVQQGVASMIRDYFSNPANKGKLVPSSLGLNDPTLGTLITQYNELQLRKERETPLVTPNSSVMQDLNTQLTNLRGSILESLNNVNKNLKLQENNFRQQHSQYRNFLSSVPHNERVLQEIRRKQSITEGLYLYLLQKREEAAISSTASSVPNYMQIDAASGYGPVEPNKKAILISSGLLGFFLAFGFVYFRSLFNDKVNSREDLTKYSRLPVVGEIAHISKMKNALMTILDRSIIGEQFRAIRTNISFTLKGTTKKVILLTSSVSGEGKSFVSLNLAAVYAMAGKKVALLEFDIRKPFIHHSLNLNNEIGLSNYLKGDVFSISDICCQLKEVPGLYIYPSGPVASNPADLLLSERMPSLFEILRLQYDIIIVDSPPINPVSDAFVLGEYSDAVLYVIRQRYTSKKQLELLDNLIRTNRLNNLMLLLNDVKTGGQYGYDYYGTGSKVNHEYFEKRNKVTLS
jgi:capsular exopolysaccharide synthesis family protein